MKRVYRVGTRGSALALAQTGLVIEELKARIPGFQAEPVIIRTTGDRIQDRSLAESGGKGLFVKELERALQDGEIDFAVHSGKDLPAAAPEGFSICAVLPREDPADLFLTRSEEALTPDSPSFVLGTSSPRRKMQFSASHPNAQVRLLRGNITTRLERLRAGEYSGILLAAAGVRRLGADLSGLHVERLCPDTFLPAACQGHLALECCSGAENMMRILQTVHSEPDGEIFAMERTLMRLLGADCHDAAGVYVTRSGDGYCASAFYRNPTIVRARFSKDEKNAALPKLAEKILRGGVLDESKR